MYLIISSDLQKVFAGILMSSDFQKFSLNIKVTLGTQSDDATPYNKGYERNIWLHVTNCMVLFGLTMSSSGPQNH